jgi:hypothetical protein
MKITINTKTTHESIKNNVTSPFEMKEVQNDFNEELVLEDYQR